MDYLHNSFQVLRSMQKRRDDTRTAYVATKNVATILKIGTRRVHVSAKKLDSHFMFS